MTVTTAEYPWPSVQFVTGPSADATVRLDLYRDSGAGAWTSVDDDGFSLGVPELLGDIDGVAVEYSTRTLTIPVVIEGTLAQAMAVQSALARELLRRRNWLRVQFGPTATPVWFATYRSQPGDLELTDVRVDEVGTPDLWRIVVTLEAEPFAYGARVTAPLVNVANDPSVAGGVRTVLPAVLGDGPAPLRVDARLRGTADGFRPLARLMLAISSRAVDRTPVVITAAQMTLVNSSTRVDGTQYVGGSSVQWSSTVALALSPRASRSISLPVGVYRVLVRVTRLVASTTGTLQVRLTQGAITQTTPAVTLWPTSVAGTPATWVDLGLVQMPAAGQIPRDVLAAAPARTTSVVVAGSASANGRYAVDSVVLVPVDDDTDNAATVLFADFTDSPGPAVNTSAAVWDGDEETLYQRTGTSDVSQLRAVHQGVFPEVIPGAVNALTLLHSVQSEPSGWSTGYVDDIALTTDVTVSYHPRWLWIGGS